MFTTLKKRACFATLLTLPLAAHLSMVAAHEGPAHGPEDGMVVTRHFTGLWDQVGQEAQGIVLEIVAQPGGTSAALAYWFTYGADRRTAWYLGLGDLVADRVELVLYDSVDVGFMQAAQPVNDSVVPIGTMTIAFDSCTSGSVEFATEHPEVGAGSFGIERLASIVNTHCTGGIADDQPADAMFGSQHIGLRPARTGIEATGEARYEQMPGYLSLEFETRGLPDGDYRLYAGAIDRGHVPVQGGYGEARFSSPQQDGHRLLNFDPRGLVLELHNEQGPVLSSFDSTFRNDGYGQYGYGHAAEDHEYDCAEAPGPGHGGIHGGPGDHMAECVEDGEVIELEVDLTATGVVPGATGRAEWAMTAHGVEFAVEIRDVPAGTYALRVGGVEVGHIQAIPMHDGIAYGRITFRDPQVFGREPLDFEPRGQLVEILQADAVVLAADFPGG